MSPQPTSPKSKAIETHKERQLGGVGKEEALRHTLFAVERSTWVAVRDGHVRDRQAVEEETSVVSDVRENDSLFPVRRKNDKSGSSH